MNRDEFFQRAMLEMASKIMERTDKEPTPLQLALKAKEYAAALAEEMMTGLTELDIAQELAGQPIAPPVLRDAPPAGPPPRVPGEPPTLTPQRHLPKCPKCDAAMKERQGPTGRFLGCSKFPACKGTRPG